LIIIIIIILLQIFTSARHDLRENVKSIGTSVILFIIYYNY